MQAISIRRFLSRGVGLAAVGAAGLALAATATSATSTIQVSSLAVVSGNATGTVSGFQPGSPVTINGTGYVADGSGTVNLVAAPLAGANTLSIGFVDGDGTPQTVSGPLRDAVTGTQLSQAEVTDLTPSLTAPMTLSVESSSGNTTARHHGRNHCDRHDGRNDDVDHDDDHRKRQPRIRRIGRVGRISLGRQYPRRRPASRRNVVDPLEQRRQSVSARYQAGRLRTQSPSLEPAADRDPLPRARHAGNGRP